MKVILMRKKMLGASIALATAVVLTGCGGGSNTTPSEPTSDGSGASAAADALPVVATTTQVADLVRNVAGDRAEVTQLVQPNESAHSFDPTAADLLAVSEAKVLVVNGAGLEPWLDSVTAAAGFSGLRIDSSEGIELGGSHSHDDDYADEADDDHAEEADDDHAEEKNPHIWMAPANAEQMVRNIADGLAKADPDSAQTYEDNAVAYIAKLTALDKWVSESINQVPEADRLMVSNHDAFYYYLKAYHITFVGSIIPNFEDNAEPSAAQLQELIVEIKKLGVKAIFSEAAIDPKAAEQVAKSAGVTVYSGDDALYGDSLGPAGSDGATYIDATIHNTTVLLTAWGATPVALPSELAD